MSSVKHFSMWQRDDMSGLHRGYRFLDVAYSRIDARLWLDRPEKNHAEARYEVDPRSW